MSTFSSIFGQPYAVDWLRRSFAADRLPHGLIFAGPAGVGKATVARELARLFLCETPKDGSACDRCESCLAFNSGAHPDYHVVTKELIRYHDKTGKSKGISLGIEVVRAELIVPSIGKANLGRGKVFVIEQAESMSAQAQNAILKTLEEPLGRSLIVLLTDQADALLPTIRSRCQIIGFASLHADAVAEAMHARGIETAAAARAATLANGSLGMALKWIEDDVIAPADELLGQIDGLFAKQAPADLPGWFKKAAEAYAERQLKRDELASKDQATREALALYLKLAAEHVRRRLAVLSEAGDAGDADAMEQACAVIDAIVRAETYLDSNVNVSLVFQQLSVALVTEVGA